MIRRYERIRADLAKCQEIGAVRSYYTTSPDRTYWVVEGKTFATRVWTTSEVEAFLTGALA